VLRGTEIGLTHGFFLAGPFIKVRRPPASQHLSHVASGWVGGALAALRGVWPSTAQSQLAGNATSSLGDATSSLG
jgi:hypothetical protein